MNMPDYKEMYLKLFRASEEAVNLLIAAQRECEELYVNAPEPELKVITMHIQHLPRPAGGSADEILKLQLVHTRNQLADVALNIGLQVAVVKHIPIGEFPTDKTRHRAFPDALVHFR